MSAPSHGSPRKTPNLTSGKTIPQVQIVLRISALVLFLLILVIHVRIGVPVKTGEGYTTMAKPIKAYIDPLNSNTRVEYGKRARYVLASDTSQTYLAGGEGDLNVSSPLIENFLKMPAADYWIYPEGSESAYFWWSIE